MEYFRSKIEACPDARTKRLTVHLIDDQSLGLHRNVYREAKTEKEARATHYSAIKRALGKDTIVVADGLNYIKGFRYQLYCEAKAVQTPSCVVWSSVALASKDIRHRGLLTDDLRGTCRNADRHMSQDQ